MNLISGGVGASRVYFPISHFQTVVMCCADLRYNTAILFRTHSRGTPMVKLDRKTFNEIVDILTPYVNSVEDQRGLVESALFDAPRLQQQIQFGGASRTFATLLVRKAVDYGQITLGEHALSVILDQVYTQVGVTQQARIDELQTLFQEESTPPPVQAEAPPVEEKTLPTAAVPTQNKHIFISYSSADRAAFVEPFVKHLHDSGYDIWVDNVDPEFGGIVGGTEWQQSLADAVQQAAAVCLVITPDSVRSKWVRAEIKRAQELNKTILPIVVRELKTDEDKAAMAAFKIGNLHYVSFVRMGHQNALSRVLADLQRLHVPKRVNP